MKSPKLTINAARLEQDFNELAEIGATVDGGVSRLALSNEDLLARAWFADRLDAAGLHMRDDDAGNLSGVLMCGGPKARTLILGSHLDSVPNGGRYDGSIGVLAALECARVIKAAGLKLRVNLEVINFTDEEGCWQSLFGSRGLTGNLHENYTIDKDADYGPFRAALFRAGIRPADVANARRDPKTVAGYLELHIEQGYRLDRDGVEIGVVSGIVGRATHQVIFHGQASHSGTTERERRRDALLGASQFIVLAHELWRDRYPEGVFTCGNLQVGPGAFNIIPNETRLTIECRHPDADTLAQMQDEILDLARQQAAAHGLFFTSRRMAQMPAVNLDDQVIGAIEQACELCQASHTRLISYAGHDAQMMTGFTPSGMIFVPSVGGISHSPREFTHWEHVVKGANVMLQTILLLAKRL